MSNEKIRELLSELNDEVQNTEIDDNTRASLQELDADIHKLLGSDDADPGVPAVVEKAKLLETRFAIDHPCR